MTTTRNTALDPVLRSLDAARTDLTTAEQQRARATLDRIVATVPTPPTGAALPEPAGARRRRPRYRPLLVLPAAIAVVIGWLLFIGTGDDRMAYVSWTPSPTALTGREIDLVAPACRDRLHGGSLDLNKARLVLAERRGDWAMLLYRTENPDVSGSCLARHSRGGSDVDVVGAGIGGSSGPAQKAPAQGFTEGAIAQYQDASITDGAVGDGVTGVTIHADDLTVHASVQNGRYVAWWPGAAFRDEPAQPSGRGGPVPILTYDLTLTDGTVVRHAQPARPS